MSAESYTGSGKSVCVVILFVILILSLVLFIPVGLPTLIGMEAKRTFSVNKVRFLRGANTFLQHRAPALHAVLGPFWRKCILPFLGYQ